MGSEDVLAAVGQAGTQRIEPGGDRVIALVFISACVVGYALVAWLVVAHFQAEHELKQAIIARIRAPTPAESAEFREWFR